MAINFGKAALASVALALAPVALTEISGRGEAPLAHGGVSAQVVIGSPYHVVGFSYADPHFYGHIHSSPVACHAGALYFYPHYGVYGHYNRHAAFHRYARPVHWDLRAHSPIYHHRRALHGVHRAAWNGRGHDYNDRRRSNGSHRGHHKDRHDHDD